MPNLEASLPKIERKGREGGEGGANLRSDLDDDAISSTSRLAFDPLTIPPSISALTTVEESPERKILCLKSILEKDPVAADLKWSLFVAASHSYRYDSCLKPFPPMYIQNECKDIDALVSGDIAALLRTDQDSGIS